MKKIELTLRKVNKSVQHENKCAVCIHAVRERGKTPSGKYVVTTYCPFDECQSRFISGRMARKYGCEYCLDVIRAVGDDGKRHKCCPYEECKYKSVFKGTESYEDYCQQFDEHPRKFLDRISDI